MHWCVKAYKPVQLSYRHRCSQIWDPSFTEYTIHGASTSSIARTSPKYNEVVSLGTWAHT